LSRLSSKYFNNDEEEFRHRKKNAYDNWDRIFRLLSSGIKLPKEEIVFAMTMCNLSDYALLNRGYDL